MGHKEQAILSLSSHSALAIASLNVNPGPACYVSDEGAFI